MRRNYLRQQDCQLSLGKASADARSPPVPERQTHETVNVFLRLGLVLKPPLGDELCRLGEILVLVRQHVVRKDHMSL